MKMKVLVVCKDEGSKKDESCIMIEEEGFEVVYAWKNTLGKKELEGVDFVISIGGDGTALSASHYLEDKPLLAVNSKPGKSEGVLTVINIGDLDEKLKEIKKKGFELEELERMKVSVNGKDLGMLVLNDVFIANEKAYLISRYKLKIDGQEEEQKSSGLIFSTGTGSTAWFRSAGGKPFSAQSKHIKMIVREPYHGKLSSFSMVRKTLNEKEKAEVEILCPSVLAIDSIREFKLKEGDRVVIEIAEKALKRIV